MRFRTLCYRIACVLILSGMAAAQVSVNVSQPASTNVATTVTISATASSSYPVTGWFIYVDDRPVWNTGASGSISAAVSLSPGQHKIDVRAWDSSGRFGTRTMNVSAASAGNTPVVTVSAPLAGAAVGSPTRIAASATSAYPITGWAVYANNQTLLTQNGGALDAAVNLPPGASTIRVRAWNAMGAYGDAPLFQVSNSGSSLSLPAVPASAKVFYSIEDTPNWQDCTKCAADPRDPNPPLAQYYRWQYQSSPSLSGSSTKLWIGGSSPYANALHWTKFGNQSWAKNFVWEFWVYGENDLNSAQNIEFDLWQSVDRRKYMFGTQCNYMKGIWQGWNEPTNSWVDLAAACPKFQPGKWTRVIWHLERTWDNQLHYISVTQGDVTTKIDMYQSSAATDWDDDMGVQFQQDMNWRPDAHAMWIDNVKLSIW